MPPLPDHRPLKLPEGVEVGLAPLDSFHGYSGMYLMAEP